MPEQEQQFLVLLAVDLGLLAFTVLGVAIWTGRWRSWADSTNYYAERIVGLPWIALCFIIMRVAVFLNLSFGVDAFVEALLVLGSACLFIGVITSYWQSPKLALPPWYSEHLKEKQSQEDRGDGIAG